MNFNRKFFVILLIITFAIFAEEENTTVIKEKKFSEIYLKCGDLDLYYYPDGGLKLNAFGVPVILKNSFTIVKPGWTEVIYSWYKAVNFMENIKIENFENGKKITIIHKLPDEKNIPFMAKEIFIIKPDNTFLCSLEMVFNKNIPAIFEWEPASLNANILFGRPYIMSNDKATTNSVLPIEAVSDELMKSIITQSFKTFMINSLIGEIVIETKPKYNFTLIDHRKNKWAEPEKPCFWLGLLDTDIKPEKNYFYSINFKFPQKLNPNTKDISDITKTVSAKKTDSAQIPNYGQDYIIPTPKKLNYINEKFFISNDIQIYTGKNPSVGIENAVKFLLKDLKDNFNIMPNIVRDEFPKDKKLSKCILLSEQKRWSFPSELCENVKIPIPNNDEGYSLLVSNDFISIAANTEKGIFYAITSLVQLITLNDNGLFFKGAKIWDYPSLSFRGIHCFTAKNGGDEISKAVCNLMARFKINTLLFESEYIIWDSHPELAHKTNGMTKSDAQKVIDAAKENFIEIIPLVQSLGHSDWMFTNNLNLDLAEDPERPYSYCPTNPDSYKLVFSVYQEALEFFKPKFFHIGHDEINTSASRFPYRSKSSEKNITELIIDDIVKINDWFKEKNIKVMIWGDMFIAPGETCGEANAPNIDEAKNRRKMLPKDIIITDWHYGIYEPHEFKSLKVFKDEGIDAIGAGWYLAKNIANFTKAVKDFEQIGYLQTTWAGFNFKINDNPENWYQYWAYLWAAEYSWTTENISPEKLPFDAKEKFFDIWFSRKPVLEKKKGYYFNLTPLLNRKIYDDKNKNGWLCYGSELDLSAMPKGETIFGNTKFLIETNQNEESAVFLSGKLNPPGEYPKKINLRFEPIEIKEIHFMITSSFRAKDDTNIGNIKITYETEKNSVLPLIYGKNIFAYTEGKMSDKTKIAWKGKTKMNQNVFVYDLTWDNDMINQKIKKITIESTGTESTPIIFAITGIM